MAVQAAVVRERAAPLLLTVGDLLQTWIAAAHDWKPSTWVCYRGTVGRLLADPVATRPLGTLRPSTVRAVMQANARHPTPAGGAVGLPAGCAELSHPSGRANLIWPAGAGPYQNEETTTMHRTEAAVPLVRSCGLDALTIMRHNRGHECGAVEVGPGSLVRGGGSGGEAARAGDDHP